MSNALIDYTLHLADDALIMGQRLSEWTGHGPVLEQDIAITNLSLDYIGQARNFYQYAAHLVNDNKKKLPASLSLGEGRGEASEDTLAYLRDAWDYKNHLLVELPNGDWAQSVLKIFFFSNYQYLLYKQLQSASDNQISAIAEKSLKEVAYHLKWSSEWVIRLGDGTDESRQRLLNALNELWPYIGELFLSPSYHQGWVNFDVIKENWYQKVEDIFEEATIPLPTNREYMQMGGTEGKHTEHLGYILAEMQFLQRAYPGCEW